MPTHVINAYVFRSNSSPAKNKFLFVINQIELLDLTGGFWNTI